VGVFAGIASVIGAISERFAASVQGYKSEASVAQMAKDFEISETCLTRWLKIADREYGGLAPLAFGDRGGGAGDSAELRRRNKLLEENEILRCATAYFARDVLPK
jgi:transposase